MKWYDDFIATRSHAGTLEPSRMPVSSRHNCSVAFAVDSRRCGLNKLARCDDVMGRMK